MFKYLLKYQHFILLSLVFSGCKIYSFTGASIPPEAKTISIQYIKNNASLVVPTLSQQLTDALKDKFTSQTNLSLVKSGGDMDVAGAIINYTTTPIAIQSNETASQNRLTITVSINFYNKYDEKKNFETNFSRYADYPSTKPLSEMSEVIATVVEYLVDDIFNKAVVNW